MVLASLVCVLLLVFAHSASAQTPTPDATLRAFRIAEKHIREWQLPPDPSPKGPENSEVPKAVGACITLKLRGEVIGRGAAWSEAIAGPEAMSSDVLRRAILAAMQQAEPKLGVPNDAMRDAAIKLVTPDILISVELAGPLSVVEFNTWEDAEVTLRPGLDGVATRIGGEAGAKQGTLHAIFPSQMMLGNMLPHRAMGAVASKVMGEGGAAAALDDPKKLRESMGVRMYRFRVGQVVQGTDSRIAPRVVYRGAELQPNTPPMTRAELVEMEVRLEQSLRARCVSWTAQPPERIVKTQGEENPSSQPRETMRLRVVSSTSTASDWESDTSNALAAFSLRRSAALRNNLDIDNLADLILLGNVARSIKQGFCDLQEANLRQLAFTVVQRGLASMFDLSPWTEDSSILFPEYWNAGPSGTPVWVEAVRGLVLSKYPVCDSGAVGTIELFNAQATARRLEECVLPLLKDSGRSGIISAMPFLGWAAVEVGDARASLRTVVNHFGLQDRQPVVAVADEIPAAIALRQMRSDCWKHQLSITDATEDTLDMIGGIIFTAGDGKGGGNPYPTWQCVRPLAFIATMLRDPRLTEPGERPEQIVRLMQAARFLRQLQVDEASAWMYPDPKLAIGGIRASTWDNSLPVDATSMTLLFVVELIKSLDALSAAQQPPAIAPAAPGADAPKPK